jgi:glycerate 2-kinase
VTRPVDSEMPRSLLMKYKLWDSLPPSIQQAIATHPDPVSDVTSPINIIIGSNRNLVEAAKEKACELGFEPQFVTQDLIGEARQAGAAIAQKLLECPPGGCLIQGGETTVTVRGDGKGGRNQELALAAALKLAGAGQVALLSAASDGVDGPTDAAGGWVDGGTIQDADALALDAANCLEENNSYLLLDRVGRLIKVGPTGTNVNDLVVGLKYHSKSG